MALCVPVLVDRLLFFFFFLLFAPCYGNEALSLSHYLLSSASFEERHHGAKEEHSYSREGCTEGLGKWPYRYTLIHSNNEAGISPSTVAPTALPPLGTWEGAWRAIKHAHTGRKLSKIGKTGGE